MNVLPQRRAAAPWLLLSGAAAVVAAVGNVVALTHVDDVYGRETSSFVNQAIAQDIVNLAVVAPAIVILAVLAYRGSLGAYLMWLGALAFTVYNYVICTFSIHVGVFANLDAQAVKARLAHAGRERPDGSSSPSRRCSPCCG